MINHSRAPFFYLLPIRLSFRVGVEEAYFSAHNAGETIKECSSGIRFGITHLDGALERIKAFRHGNSREAIIIAERCRVSPRVVEI